MRGYIWVKRKKEKTGKDMWKDVLWNDLYALQEVKWKK